MGVLLAGVAITCAGAAHAQDLQIESAQPQDPNSLGEIIVTAQKREERLQKVPISITAVSADQLQTAGVIGARDLPQVASGLVQIEGATGNTGQLAIIRGVGSSIAQLGVDSSVATYVDGVYSASKYANAVDFADIERIEVLKGPQGTLFGRNATGGAINIITKKPSNYFEGRASISYGRFNETEQRVYLTGPIAPTLAASIGVVARQGGNFARNLPTGDKFGGRQNLTLNGKLAWDANDRFSVDAGFSYARLRDNWLSIAQTAANGTLPSAVSLGGVPAYSADRTNLNFTPLFSVNSYRGHVTLKYELDAISLVSITSYQADNDYLNQDQDGTTAVFNHVTLKARNRAIQQEVQIVSNPGGGIQWIVGGYFIAFKERYAPLGLEIPFSIGIDAESKTDAGAIFGQGTYEIGARTKITAGLRYSIERREMESVLYIPEVITLAESGRLNETFRKLTWRLSVNHDLSDDIMAYASYNRGFKSGAFNITTADPDQKPIGAEVLDAFEVGIKSQILDQTLQINLSGYYYDYKNIQVFRFDPSISGSTVIEAAGAAELYGIDGDVVFVPTRGLRLNGGINIEHSEYTKYDGASGFTLSPSGQPVATVFPSYEGRQVFYAPKLTFNLGGSYEFSPTDGALITAAANYSYHSKFEEQATDFDAKLRGLGILNASLTLSNDPRSISIEVWGRNITNRRRIGQYIGGSGLFDQIMRPASYGVTLGAEF